MMNFKQVLKVSMQQGIVRLEQQAVAAQFPVGLYIGDNIYKFIVNTVGKISINIEQVMAHKELAMSPLDIKME